MDVCAGHFLAEWLRSQGHDVVEVRDKNNRMADGDILAWAVSEGRILVTMDKDFTQFIKLKKIKHTGVIHHRKLTLYHPYHPWPGLLKFMKKILRKKLLLFKGEVKYLSRIDSFRLSFHLAKMSVPLPA